MLISSYRTSIKTKRWYIKVFFHYVNISKVSAWLVYRRHCEQRKVPKKSQLNLLEFTMSIASALILIQEPFKNQLVDLQTVNLLMISVQQRKNALQNIPVSDVRYDNIGHCHNFDKRKTNVDRVKQELVEITGKNVILCLCLSNNRNCFYDFFYCICSNNYMCMTYHVQNPNK